MSHKEEQIQEVEALESIFGEEIESWYFIFGYIFGYFVFIIFFFYSNWNRTISHSPVRRQYRAL